MADFTFEEPCTPVIIAWSLHLLWIKLIWLNFNLVHLGTLGASSRIFPKQKRLGKPNPENDYALVTLNLSMLK